MTIQDDFAPYVDGNGLLAPNPVSSGQMRGSDNGPCFTSEYVVIRRKNNVPIDTGGYLDLIDRCQFQGYLSRAPGDATLGNPDNHYGVYAAHVALGITPNFKFYWQLLRQPQLYFASICAHQKASRWKFWQWPLAAFTATIIATSCMFTSTDQADPRRLAWLLIQATVKDSVLCRLASKLWFRRLRKDYTNGMKDVAVEYYQPHNVTSPYARWWLE